MTMNPERAEALAALDDLLAERTASLTHVRSRLAAGEAQMPDNPGLDLDRGRIVDMERLNLQLRAQRDELAMMRD